MLLKLINDFDLYIHGQNVLQSLLGFRQSRLQFAQLPKTTTESIAVQQDAVQCKECDDVVDNITIWNNNNYRPYLD